MSFVNNRYHGCIAFVVLFFVLTSCAPKVFTNVSPGKQSYTINIEFSPAVPDVLQKEIINEFNNFCARSPERPVRFIDAKGDRNADITLRVQVFKPVTPGQSAAGLIISLAGFSMPILMAAAEAPFVAVFWYFPKSQSFAELTLRNGQFSVPTKMYRLGGPGFLMKASKQEVRHAKAYRDFFGAMANFYEQDLRKTSKKR